jgi:hypothetical protein
VSALSIASEAVRRLDSDEFVEVEIENGLQCLTGGSVAQRLGQCFEPLRVLVLQGDEFGDGIVPALMAAAAVGGSAVADDRGAGVARAIAGLPLGPGKRPVASRFASSGDGRICVT